MPSPDRRTPSNVSTGRQSDQDISSFLDTLNNWGRWGNDDERGTLNLIQAEHINRAAALAKTGVVISCQREITTIHSDENPVPMVHFMTSTGESAPTDGQGIARDWFGMPFHGHAVTHLDSLGHFFLNGLIYNGRPANVVRAEGGAGFGSIAAASGGVVSRGVLLDIPRLVGREFLAPDHVIDVEQLESAEKLQGVKAGTGDILVIRTGRDMRKLALGASRYRPGMSVECLPWLHRREISVLVSDESHDAQPLPSTAVPTPIHAVGLVAMGLWLVDNAQLEALAQQCQSAECWEFMMILAPLHIEGASGSPINPLAIL